MTDLTISGPKGGIFGMKNATDFQNDPLHFLTKVAREYGDIIHFKFGPYEAYILKHPDYIHEALVTNVRKLHKFEKVIHPFEKFVGRGTFLLEEDEWQRQRKLVQPAFHTQRIKNYMQLILNHTQKMLDSWEGKAEVEIAHEMHTTTMGIIAEILFNVSDISQSTLLSEAIATLSEMTVLESSAMMPVPDWVPTRRNLKENQAMKILDDFMMKVVRDRRAQSDNDMGDVLSALLNAKDDAGNSMTDKEIRDELMTLFVAGHETTANSLAWSLYELSKHAAVQDALFAESSSVLQGRLPTLEDLSKMNYGDKVIRETMRMYPPVWMLPTRSPIENITIGGHTIPKGSMVFISPWVMHYDERYFENPETFDPERFEGDYKKRYPTYAYFPFSGGPRICIGGHLAMMESETILTSIIQKYKFSLVSGQTITPQPLVTLVPKDGIHLRLTPRKS